jgi:hypothetical protein
MGFLKKIFKPVSKVLDKIVPNEIKPALPYLSAFAPMMLGPGIMGSSMLHRGLMSGGLNLLGQLSQEGSEGDANLLSTLMAGGIGALTAPGAGGKTIGVDKFDNPIIQRGPTGFQDFAAKGIKEYGAESAGGEILGGLSKASKFLTDPGLVKYGIPAAQGTMDLAYADAVRQQRDLERDQESDDGGGEDANRALAIRQSMEAYGFTEEEILDAIAAAGYKKGGRVALAFGGIDSAVEKVDDVEIKENIQFAQNMDMPMEDLVEEFMIIHKRKPNSLDELKRFYKDKYEYKGPADVKMKETMTERFTAKDGGMMSVLPRGKEMDYRDGGMIPIGSKEKADDVPARLSKNEFVMTADAVRAAGGGSVNEGARRMYNLMNNLEARA